MTRGMAGGRRCGFTIIEAMVTLALFGLCAITICNLIDVAMKGVNRQHAHDSLLRNIKSSVNRMQCELREAKEIQQPYSGSDNQVQFTRYNPQYDSNDPNSPKTLTVRYYLDGNGPTYTLVRESWTDPNRKCQLGIADWVESLSFTNDPVNATITVSLAIHTDEVARSEAFIIHRRTL